MMMMTSKRWIRIQLKILIMLQITWNLEVLADDKVCAQCATPNLQNNWGLTGLPLKPSNLKFDKDICGKAEDSAIQVSEYTSGNCASSCFEIMIPLNGEYGFVRGCHENFVWDEFKVVKNESCHLNLDTKVGDTNIYAGYAFCAPNISTTVRCNKKLLSTLVLNDGVSGCDAEATHTCKNCNEFSGSGSCSTSTAGTCNGVYCTKTSGKINGDFYESRGCANFNPIGSDVCSWTDQVFNLTTGVGTVNARKKRSVSLPFRANQCYCQGELCNSSSRLSSLFLSIFSASFLVFL